MGLREIKTDENRSAEGELSAERLRELLDYDPQTGEFAWKRVHLGYFDTLEEATAARQDAEERFHGPS